MMADTIISVAAIIISIVTSIFVWKSEQKNKKIRAPLDWNLDVYAFRPNQDLQNHKLTKTYNPSMFEVIINGNEGDEENRPHCDMSPIGGLDCLHVKRQYNFIFIRNTSQNAVELLSFELGKKEAVSIKYILLANDAILLALPSHGKPTSLIISFSGSSLLYNIKSNVGFLRPADVQ